MCVRVRACVCVFRFAINPHQFILLLARFFHATGRQIVVDCLRAHATPETRIRVYACTSHQTIHTTRIHIFPSRGICDCVCVCASASTCVYLLQTTQHIAVFGACSAPRVCVSVFYFLLLCMRIERSASVSHIYTHADASPSLRLIYSIQCSLRFCGARNRVCVCVYLRFTQTVRACIHIESASMLVRRVHAGKTL